MFASLSDVAGPPEPAILGAETETAVYRAIIRRAGDVPLPGPREVRRAIADLGDTLLGLIGRSDPPAYYPGGAPCSGR